ncbi:MAG: flavodoxin domain-containing protein, partial [Oscillospiraceae bacterium]|nr:flavodoxin domain-containing protein [Oscillospiraceae bacterium]
MVMLYFSGTGNSKYIAELFARNMNCACHSIEEKIDFAHEDIIDFCYPIYGSRVPRVMREFVANNLELLKNKKLIIFCTQMIFSGDGARVFTDMFPRGYIDVIYAEHFLMPNNVCNLFFLPLASEKQTAKYISNAERKMQIVCRNIKTGIVKRRGFNVGSRILGLFQGVFMPMFEKKTLDSIRINGDCNQCLLCVSICP